MSGKNQFQVTINFQSTDPRTGFLPINANTFTGSVPSGNPNGVMTSTNTIYSQIMEVSRMDNIGLEITWSGTPTGVISVLGSNSGVNFYALTFDPTLAQPAGSAGGYIVDINQYPWKYILIEYDNSSGDGVLNIFAQLKDLN